MTHMKNRLNLTSLLAALTLASCASIDKTREHERFPGDSCYVFGLDDAVALVDAAYQDLAAQIEANDLRYGTVLTAGTLLPFEGLARQLQTKEYTRGEHVTTKLSQADDYTFNEEVNRLIAQHEQQWSVRTTNQARALAAAADVSYPNGVLLASAQRALQEVAEKQNELYDYLLIAELNGVLDKKNDTKVWVDLKLIPLRGEQEPLRARAQRNVYIPTSRTGQLRAATGADGTLVGHVFSIFD